MNIKAAFSLLAVITLTLSSAAWAGARDYQVTGPVIELTDTMIVVEKSKGKDERWEIARDANTKLPPDLKVGDKVTIHYTMTATSIEAKAGKGAKAKGAQKKEAAGAEASPKP